MFLASTSAIALSHVAASSAAAEPPARLSDHIHTDVRSARVELSRDENAYWDWQQATKKMTPLRDFVERYLRENAEALEDTDEFDFEDAVVGAEQLSTQFPQGHAGECARAWLEANHESLTLIDQGLAKARYQIPQERLQAVFGDANDMIDTRVAWNGAILKSTWCNFYLHSGDQDAAGKALLDLLNIARLAQSGDGYLVHYLVAMGVHTKAMDAVNTYAFHPQSSRERLEEIRRWLQRTRPNTQMLARAFQMEVGYFEQEISRLSAIGSLRQLVSDLLKDRVTLDGDSRGAEIQAGVLKLFDGHPNPFDPAETVKIYSGAVATMLHDLSSSWLDREKDITKPWLAEVAPWPQSLSLTTNLHDFFGDGQEPPAVTDRDIEEARKQLLLVQNPIGKQMLKSTEVFDGVRRSYHIARLRSEVSSLFIACRLFRDQERRWPRQLSELVQAQLIDAIPVDPFSGQAVQYDPNRRLIWSFGENERDDGGDWDFDAKFPDGDDIVWRLPG